MKKILILCLIGSALTSSNNTFSMLFIKRCKIQTPRIQQHRRYMGGAEFDNSKIMLELQRLSRSVDQQNNLLLDQNNHLQHNNDLLRLLLGQNKTNLDTPTAKPTAYTNPNHNHNFEDPHHMAYYSSNR